MKTRWTVKLLWVVGLLGLAACAPTILTEPPGVEPPLPDRTPPGATRYEVVAADSEIYARVFRGGRLAKLGHNHVVVFNDLRGYVALGEAPDGALFDFAVAAGDVSVDPPALRERQESGFGSEISDQARAGTRANMLGESVLDAQAYPYIVISSSVIEGPFDALRVTADVAIRGVTRSVVLPVSLARDGRRLVATGRFELLQTDFGIEPFTALGGALKVKDRVELVFRITAEAAGQPRSRSTPVSAASAAIGVSGLRFQVPDLLGAGG